MRRGSGRSGTSSTRQHVASGYQRSNLTFGPPPSNVAFVTSAATSTASFGTAFTANAPASIVAGNLLVAVYYANSETAFQTPSGWALVASTLVTNCQTAVYVKTATGAEPGTYSFPTSVSAFHAIVISQYSGSTGLDGSPSFSNTASGATGTVNSVTPAGSNEMWMVTFGQNGNRTISAGPAGLTFESSAINSNSIAAYHLNNVSAATGPASITWSATTQTPGVSLLLK